jgi:hypothetical protein
MELEVYGIYVDRDPRGNYFVSWCGWGRRVGTDFEVAMAEAHLLYQEKVAKVSF